MAASQAALHSTHARANVAPRVSHALVPTADEYGVLVESVRVNGKPRQRHVAYLGSYHSGPDGILPHWRNGPDLHYRVWWWLDALGNVIPTD
jgi:hypothetical protein